MSKTIQSIRGMHDILPGQISLWQHIEAVMRNILARYDYHEIRFPIVEFTDLFCRSIGEVTDIVEKEMYTFEDRNGDSLTLRPEGTAGCVRAGIESGLLHNQLQRLWYMGPMFRHERPQKGRYRQFHQIGVETYGMAGPDIDAELILLTARLWQELGIEDVHLELNTLGSNQARQAYRDVLVAYLNDHQGQLDEDSRRRLHSNPLRILDSKNPDMQALIESAPKLAEHLDEESLQHFDELQKMLTRAGIHYRINPRLVRGLDYYCKTVFEWVTESLGAQGTICAGGRYDTLVSQLGGRETPAAGFAIGVERLVSMIEVSGVQTPTQKPDAYLLMLGDQAAVAGIALAERLRDQLPGLKLLSHCGGGSFKSQLKKADKSGARVALIIGQEEIENQRVLLKYLREEQEQQTLAWEDLAERLTRIFNLQ